MTMRTHNDFLKKSKTRKMLRFGFVDIATSFLLFICACPVIVFATEPVTCTDAKGKLRIPEMVGCRVGDPENPYCSASYAASQYVYKLGNNHGGTISGDLYFPCTRGTEYHTIVIFSKDDPNTYHDFLYEGHPCGPDDDGDSICNAYDNCPGVSNYNQADEDDDGKGDVCDDDCPDDPNKTEPGECGCGAADISGIAPQQSTVTEGTKINAVTENPSGASVTWSIKPATKDDEGKVHASITGGGATATISKVSGEGDMIIMVTSGTCTKEFPIKIGCKACEGGNGGQCNGEAGSASEVGL